MKEKMPIELVSTGLGKTGKRGLGFRVSIKEAFDGALFHEYISTKNDAKPAVLVLGEGKPNKKGAWKVNAGNAGNAGSGTVATGTGTGTGPSSAVVPAAAVGATTTLKKL